MHAINRLKPYFPQLRKSLSANLVLPGGDFPCSKQAYLINLQKAYSWLEESILKRYINCYGTRSKLILENCHSLTDLGEHFGAGLYQKEIEYLIEYEWAETAENIIWRRTKLGLFLNAMQVRKINDFISCQPKLA